MLAETDSINPLGRSVLAAVANLESLIPARDALDQTIDRLVATRANLSFESSNPESLTGDRRLDAAIAYALLVGENWYQVLPGLYQSIQGVEKRVRNWSSGGLVMLDVSQSSALGNTIGRLIVGTVKDPRFKIDFETCDQMVGAEEVRGEGGIPRWVPRMQLTKFTPRPEGHEFTSSTFKERSHHWEDKLELGALFIPRYDLGARRYEGAPDRLKTRLRLGKDEAIFHLSDLIQNHGGYQVCYGERDLCYLTQTSDAVGIEWIKTT